jgi:alginate O-acetyltransferase complex protein AlgJ
MKVAKEIIISLAFVLILVIPIVDSVFHFIPKKKNHENRALKSKPIIDINKLDSYPKQFDDYYSDNFDLRNQFLWLNSKLKFQLFNKAPVEGKAFIGSDGWMYIIGHQMDTYLGKNIANDSLLDRYYDIFKYRKQILDSIGCKYYVVFVPTKTSIYPEYLPVSKQKSNSYTLTDQIVNLLDTVNGIKVIDLRNDLKKAKAGVRLYHKTDNHWNEYGSYFGYRAIMDELSKDFSLLKPKDLLNYEIDSVTRTGMALTNMMGIYEGVSENKITCRPKFDLKSKIGEESGYPVPPYFGYVKEYEKVFITENDSLPKMLMIRDSFGGTLIPYFRDHFSKSVFIFDAWQHEFNEDIVLNEKPDIYIQLVLEMFIPKIEKKAIMPN